MRTYDFYSQVECDWKPVNKGTTQGSVSGPHLFNVFLNDFNITLGNHDVLVKYADDSTIIAPVWKEVDYSDQLVSQFLVKIHVPSCKEVEILGITFQCDSKFSVHVKNKLIKANKSLHILKRLCKEGYSQSEIDLLLNTIVLPNINYALSVYAVSESNLTPSCTMFLRPLF